MCILCDDDFKYGHLGEQIMEHQLKCHPIPFQKLFEGRKTAEFRKLDREYKVGDKLNIKEYDPGTNTYSGRELNFWITDISTDEKFGIPIGYCVISMYPEIRY